MPKNLAALILLAFGVFGHEMYISDGMSVLLLFWLIICHILGAICIVIYRSWPFGLKNVSGKGLYLLLAPPLVPILLLDFFAVGLIVWLFMYIEIGKSENTK
jgi:hypothetical protein